MVVCYSDLDGLVDHAGCSVRMDSYVVMSYHRSQLVLNHTYYPKELEKHRCPYVIANVQKRRSLSRLLSQRLDC